MFESTKRLRTSGQQPAAVAMPRNWERKIDVLCMQRSLEDAAPSEQSK